MQKIKNYILSTSVFGFIAENGTALQINILVSALILVIITSACISLTKQYKSTDK